MVAERVVEWEEPLAEVDVAEVAAAVEEDEGESSGVI